MDTHTEATESQPPPKNHEEYRRQRVRALTEPFVRGEITQAELEEQIDKMLEDLELQAITDTLTGLPNTRGFQDALALDLRRIEVGQESGGVMVFADGDGIKEINDTRGHDVGNEAIIAIAKAIFINTDGRCLIARYGGDEFLIWFRGVTIEEAIQKVLDIKSFLALHYEKEFHELGFSAGVTPYQTGDTVETLLKESDNTMYDAKQTRRGSIAISRLKEPIQNLPPNVFVSTSHLPRIKKSA